MLYILYVFLIALLQSNVFEQFNFHCTVINWCSLIGNVSIECLLFQRDTRLCTRMFSLASHKALALMHFPQSIRYFLHTKCDAVRLSRVLCTFLDIGLTLNYLSQCLHILYVNIRLITHIRYFHKFPVLRGQDCHVLK